ncbi:unnamed protein product [Allacma fusca]|uniref:Uncharacterized protein n=1 Tax=Allacma fusca TaxID=39272 RepID=A0A8J2JLH0_9HEXA|nr:unnamed protein product [Allacma fusca]
MLKLIVELSIGHAREAHPRTLPVDADSSLNRAIRFPGLTLVGPSWYISVRNVLRTHPDMQDGITHTTGLGFAPSNLSSCS